MTRILKNELFFNVVQSSDVLEAVLVQVWEDGNGSYSVVCSCGVPGVDCAGLNTYDLPTLSAALGVAGHTFTRLYNFITN